MSIKIVREVPDAVYHLYSLAEDKLLCNNVRDRGSIESKISLPTTDISFAYLVLAFTRSNNVDVIKWKVSFNDVILTRELKPHIEKSIDDKFTQSIFVYDVSKIISKNESSMRISCSAKGYINLDSAILLTITRYKGFHTYIDCEVDPYTISGNIIKTCNLAPSFTVNEVYLHLGIVSPTIGNLEIRTDRGVTKKFNLLKGHNIIEAFLGNESLSFIEIQSSSSARHVITCLSLMYTQYPRIEIENLVVQESIAKLELKNTGNSICDSLDIVLLRYGIPLKKMNITSPKPGEGLSLEVNLNDIVKQGINRIDGLTLRILCSKAHKRFEYDVPIKVLKASPRNLTNTAK
ncbi:MAG: hypothetical protein LM582_00265 [Desulfurococcaceae archaeon]|jgi:hypothetical protein|nr:hypothetical protein [Desulfurococcaceae archaeon]